MNIEYTVKVTFQPETITTFRCVVYSDGQTISLTQLSHFVFIFFFHIVFVLNVFTQTVEILHVFKTIYFSLHGTSLLLFQLFSSVVNSKLVGCIDCESPYLLVFNLKFAAALYWISHKAYRRITKPTVAAELKVKWCGW